MQTGREGQDEVFLLDTVTGYLQQCSYGNARGGFFCLTVYGGTL